MNSMTLLSILLLISASSCLTAGELSVTVHLLDHTRKSDTRYKLDRPIKGDKRPQFWIDWSKKWRDITVTETVKGAEATALNALLREALANSEAMHFCGHDPIYDIEAIDPEGKTLKTSLCFTCGTWVQPGKRLDIGGPPGIENPLCVALRKAIELPKAILDAEAARKAKKASK